MSGWNLTNAQRLGVFGVIADGEIDDLNDLVEVNTYIANQTQGGF